MACHLARWPLGRLLAGATSIALPFTKGYGGRTGQNARGNLQLTSIPSRGCRNVLTRFISLKSAQAYGFTLPLIMLITICFL